MAESRRQLINASSFFQREVGKFGGFRAKKSTISGESFKKGSSLGNVVGQESDVGKLARILKDTRGKTLVNEKKISLLKNRIKQKLYKDSSTCWSFFCSQFGKAG